MENVQNLKGCVFMEKETTSNKILVYTFTVEILSQNKKRLQTRKRFRSLKEGEEWVERTRMTFHLFKSSDEFKVNHVEEYIEEGDFEPNAFVMC